MIEPVVEFKPCPFCGSTQCTVMGKQVECLICGAMGPHGDDIAARLIAWSIRTPMIESIDKKSYPVMMTERTTPVNEPPPRVPVETVLSGVKVVCTCKHDTSNGSGHANECPVNIVTLGYREDDFCLDRGDPW